MVANLFKNINTNALLPALTKLQYQLEVQQQVIDADGNVILPDLTAWKLDKLTQIKVNSTTKQVTLTTKLQPTADQALEELTLLSDAWQANLANDEFTWPYSIPAQKQTLLDNQATWSLINSVKVTIKLSPEFLNTLYLNSYQADFINQNAFNQAIMAKITSRLAMYQWFITYLLGNSPLDIFTTTNKLVRSAAVPLYAQSDQANINVTSDYTGVTFNQIELSGTELTGISPLTLDFLSLIFIFCLTVENPEPTAADLTAAAQLNTYVANETPTSPSVTVPAGQALISSLTALVTNLSYQPRLQTVLKMLQSRFEDNRQTPATQLSAQAYHGSLLSFGRQQATDLKANWLADNTLLPTVADLQPAQQAIIANLIRHGIAFTLTQTHALVIDEKTYQPDEPWDITL